MSLYDREHLTVSHHFAKFGSHKYSDSRGMFLVFQVILHNHMIPTSYDFMGRSASR